MIVAKVVSHKDFERQVLMSLEEFSLFEFIDVRRQAGIVDVKRKQVMLEVSIISVELNDDYQMGIDWDVAQSTIFSWAQGRFIPVEGWSDAAIKTNVTEGTFLGGISNDHVQVMIKAFAEQGKINVLSSPKILTMDGRSAFITSEDESVFFESTVNYPGGGQSAFVTEKTLSKKFL